MEKINFTNRTDPPSGEPINAENLNKIQSNVETAINSTNQSVGSVTSTVSSLSSNIDAFKTEVNNRGTFSTSEEIDTGQKWIDGKDIYRKVFIVTKPQFVSYKYTFNHNISNFNIPFRLYGFCKDNLSTFWYPLPYTATNTADIMLYISTTQIGIEQNAYGNSRLDTFYIIAEYTKTG